MKAADAATRPGVKAAAIHCSVMALLGLCSSASLAASLSDRLTVLQADGRSHVTQHTLISDDQLLVLPLPAERISLDTRFSGPEWLTFASAHERSPDRLSLWSGSALTRYRHHYGQGLSEPEPGIFELDTREEHAPLQFDAPATVQWNVSWVLPDNARWLDFASQNETDDSGRWTRSGPLLTYQQNGGEAPQLRLRFSLTPLPATAVQPDTALCRQPNALSDACSPDVDGDGIPDFRDICLPPDSKVTALTEPQSLATRLPQPRRRNRGDEDQTLQALGCGTQTVAILSGIRFRSGQSYLDVAARTVLDRVARALQRLPDTRFEISAHTDNAGRVEHNQALSDNRARTIRHYLMLRGVAAGQILARGLGETSPAYDNALPAGRRANRRVELRVMAR